MVHLHNRIIYRGKTLTTCCMTGEIKRNKIQYTNFQFQHGFSKSHQLYKLEINLGNNLYLELWWNLDRIWKSANQDLIVLIEECLPAKKWVLFSMVVKLTSIETTSHVSIYCIMMLMFLVLSTWMWTSVFLLAKWLSIIQHGHDSEAGRGWQTMAQEWNMTHGLFLYAFKKNNPFLCL